MTKRKKKGVKSMGIKSKKVSRLTKEETEFIDALKKQLDVEISERYDKTEENFFFRFSNHPDIVSLFRNISPDRVDLILDTFIKGYFGITLDIRDFFKDVANDTYAIIIFR